ncbi:NUDIX hydrolase domain-like [Trinorchestia longiramus]|nr:NUDIX hydrolase domain-like [Trinorchestia longiramus]
MWEEKCAKNPRLHNKSKFRLAGSRKSDDKIVLMLGLASYKELCVTNLNESFQNLMKEGIKNHNDKYSYLSQTLGVGILLLSSDSHLLLLRRSMWTGEAAGKWDRPGGHPEPSNIAELARSADIETACDVPNKRSMDTGKQDFEENLNDAILRELWDSIINEARDEVGLPPSELQVPQVSLLGVSHNVDAGDRPSLEFFARLRMSSAEIRTAYARGKHAEADESTAIQLMPPHEVQILVQDVKSLFCGGSATDEFSLQERRAGNLIMSCSPALIGALLIASDLLLV